MTKNITKNDIANIIYSEVGLPLSEVIKIIDLIFVSISKKLAKEKIMKISSFGTFKVKNKKTRMGRNPKTLESAIIAERQAIIFTASNFLKSKINH